MHYKILIKTAKYSIKCNGFNYVVLYAFSLILYIITCPGNVTLAISLILSIIMLYASILSDKLNIAQLINAYNIVGLKRKEIALAFYIFVNIRILLITMVYIIAYPNFTVIAYLFVLSNIFIALVYHFSFQRG